MATLSFHAPANTDRKIRAAAKRQGMKVSRYLLETAERAVEGGQVSGLGRELEKMAIESMGLVALGRIRSRAAETGAAKMTAAQIQAVVKATRRARA